MLNVKIVYNRMAYLFDRRLSLKAKGVFATMIAYINQHGSAAYFTLDNVKELSCDGVTAFKNAVSELKECGYLEMSRNKGGDFGNPWFFTLYE